MTAAKTPNRLDLADAAYIAGLIDGEGTITLSHKHRGENRQLAVTVSNTERPVLDHLLQTIGVGKITGKRIACSHHTPSFTYAVYNRQALCLLEQIHPYLRTYKAKRAALALRDYVRFTPRNGRYTPELLLARRRFEEELLAMKPGGLAVKYPLSVPRNPDETEIHT